MRISSTERGPVAGLLVALAALAAAIQGPASARAGPVNFAWFHERATPDDQTFRLVEAPGGTTVFSANRGVHFSFAVSGLPEESIDARLVFRATASEGPEQYRLAGQSWIGQWFEAGTLEFRSVADDKLLLGVTFGGASFIGPKNSRSASLQASSGADGSSVVFESDFLDFDASGSALRDLSLAFSGLSRNLNLGAWASHGFTANGTGTFSASGVSLRSVGADGVPGDLAVAPEPSTALLAGLGLVTFASFEFRRRRKAA